MHMTTPCKKHYEDHCESELYESECSTPSRLSPPHSSKLSSRQAFKVFQKMCQYCCDENQDQESDSCADSEDHQPKCVHRNSSRSSRLLQNCSEEPMGWDGKSDNTTTSRSTPERDYGGKIVRKVNNFCGRHSKCDKLSVNQTAADGIGSSKSYPSSIGNGHFLLWNITVKFVMGLLHIFTEFFTQIGELAGSASGLQIRILLCLIVFAMIGVYYIAANLYSQLGWTVALTTGTLTDWILTAIGLLFRGIVSVLRQFACGLEHIADLGESVSCDWFSYLCDQVGWMCQRRCGFTARMFERSASRCG